MKIGNGYLPLALRIVEVIDADITEEERSKLLWNINQEMSDKDYMEVVSILGRKKLGRKKYSNIFTEYLNDYS